MKQETAIVLLSGGLDSATVLAIAHADGFRCQALSFDYGQRHEAELAAARRIVASYENVSQDVVQLDSTAFRGSALTDKSLAVPVVPGDGIPVTYVPARNTIFLAYALGFAEIAGATAIYVGVNAVDYSGYPDCRPEFIDAFRQLATVATRQAVEGSAVDVCAPLLDLGKAEIIKRGNALNVDYSLTISCYQADQDGAACGACDSCRFRARGFKEAGIPDPTVYQR